MNVLTLQTCTFVHVYTYLNPHTQMYACLTQRQFTGPTLPTSRCVPAVQAAQTAAAATHTRLWGGTLTGTSHSEGDPPPHVLAGRTLDSNAIMMSQLTVELSCLSRKLPHQQLSLPPKLPHQQPSLSPKLPHTNS